MELNIKRCKLSVKNCVSISYYPAGGYDGCRIYDIYDITVVIRYIKYNPAAKIFQSSPTSSYKVLLIHTRSYLLGPFQSLPRVQKVAYIIIVSRFVVGTPFFWR